MERKDLRNERSLNALVRRTSLPRNSFLHQQGRFQLVTGAVTRVTSVYIK